MYTNCTIALPASTGYTTAPTIYIVGGIGLGALLISPTMYYTVNSIPLAYIAGTFQAQPTIYWWWCFNITPTMNGRNTIVTAFTITNGGYVTYVDCFSAAPTIV